jgi:hypothetical protein
MLASLAEKSLDSLISGDLAGGYWYDKITRKITVLGNEITERSRQVIENKGSAGQ